jgi:NAD(P)-dependent dehydrogenase (short-subunit alcohol dehydrogenase family)
MQERRPRLEGKVAIITGAGSSGPGVGTGKAMSILFAREGARVLLVDLVADRAEETLATIRAEGGEASLYEADVTRAADCEAMVKAALDRYGGLHILVNNAAILVEGSLLEVTEEEWERVLSVNLKSAMLVSKYAVPRMIEGGGGSIVNISSGAAIRGGGRVVAYAAAKGGIDALTRQLAVAHGRDNIRVNGIHPGTLLTPMTAHEWATEESKEQRVLSTPLGTEGTAWDVAWAALFLVSDEARWVTGAMLPVDGGSLAMWPSLTL